MGLFFGSYSHAEAATAIYRSVGVGSTAPITSGASNALTITGSTATFVSDLPTNIGVGDVIQYDSDGNNSIDAIAFIHGRTSATEYTVKTAAGAAPTAVTGDNNWGIYRAYTSLFNAERGWDENTSIDVSVRNFDTWSNGKDLTATDEIWNIALYGNGTIADGYVSFANWTTDATRYIRLFTPVSVNEVGASQRHSGVWDDTKYHISHTMTADYQSALGDLPQYTRAEGIQIEYTGGAFVSPIGIAFSASGYVGYNIVTSTDTTGVGIYKGSTAAMCYIYNNIVYNVGVGIYAYGSGGTPSAYIYNNTVYNSVGTYAYDTRAWSTGPGTGHMLKNNICYRSSGTCFPTESVNYESGTGFNLSSDATAPGTNPFTNKTLDDIDFVSTASSSEDLHIQATSVAKDVGTDLSSDGAFPFNTDVDTETRLGTWDIGADEESTSDTTPPVISAIASSRDYTSMTITWTTNEAATSQVEYGPSAAYGSESTLDSELVTSHSVTITGLSPGTTYHFRIKSKDSLDNEAVSDDGTDITVVADECYNWQASHPEWTFCDDFEFNNKELWSSSTALVATTNANVNSGSYALHIPYAGTYPPTVDANRFVQIDEADMEPNNLHHFFIRGYVYFGSGGLQAEQKKLYYLWGANNTEELRWDMIVTVWDVGGNLNLWVNTNNYAWSDLTVPIVVPGALQYDTWQAVEVEVKENTVADCSLDCDGEVRVWVNDVRVVEQTGLRIRNNAEPLGDTRVGAQADDLDNSVDENRYWDNVVISTGRIGLLGGDTTSPTVDTFVIPATSTSLTVPITTFTATDDTLVTGYLLTETDSAPASDDAGWEAEAPTEYVFSTEGTKTLYAWAKDAAGNVSTSRSDSVTIALPVDDSTPPIRSDGTPSSDLSAGTTATTLSLATNEAATCKFSTTPDTSYAAMTRSFTTSGGTAHSTSLTGLENGESYTYYIRCADSLSNANTTDYTISFEVESEETELSSVKYSSTLSTITIKWETDTPSDSVVSYGLTKGLGKTKKDRDNEEKHQVTLKNLLPGTKYYFRIKSTNEDDVSDRSKIYSITTKSNGNPLIKYDFQKSAERERDEKYEQAKIEIKEEDQETVREVPQPEDEPGVVLTPQKEAPGFFAWIGQRLTDLITDSQNEIKLLVSSEEKKEETPDRLFTTYVSKKDDAKRLSEVKFQILDKKNQPIPELSATLFSDPQTTTTDQEGIATFKDVPIGRHTLAFAYEDEEFQKKVSIADTLTEEGKVRAEIVPVRAEKEGVSWWMWMIVIGLAGGMGWYGVKYWKLRAKMSS